MKATVEEYVPVLFKLTEGKSFDNFCDFCNR